MTNPKQATLSPIEQELARLRAENEALKAQALASVKTGLKITEKGGLSVYGMGRFPVTLYKSQWLKLLDKAEAIKDFIKANDEKLAAKE